MPKFTSGDYMTSPTKAKCEALYEHSVNAETGFNREGVQLYAGSGLTVSGSADTGYLDLVLVTTDGDRVTHLLAENRTEVDSTSGTAELFEPMKVYPLAKGASFRIPTHRLEAAINANDPLTATADGKWTIATGDNHVALVARQDATVGDIDSLETFEAIVA